MGSPAPAAAPAATGAYGLHAPTLDDARAALARVHGAATAEVWGAVLRDAGLTGSEAGPDAFARLIAAMVRSGSPVTALCARSLQIRLTSYELLKSAHAIAHHHSVQGSTR